MKLFEVLCNMGDQQGHHGVPYDAGTMQMFQAFALFMQQQQAAERREVSTTNALHSIVNKMDQFKGKDVSKYLKKYEKEMEINRVTAAADMLANFELVVVPEIRAHIRDIRRDHGDDWGAFSKALKQEYFMEDSERVTKRTFLEWVARPKEGISPMELLREFEKRYAQLSTTEQVTLDAEKVELFLQATGSGIQEKLELLLEDQSTEEGLKTEWKDVEDAVSLLAKRQRRRDKLVINSSTPTPTPITPPEIVTKSPTINQKGNESSMLDELVKGMREMKLKLARLEEKGQPSAQPTIGGGQRVVDKDLKAKKGLCIDAYGVIAQTMSGRIVIVLQML